MMVKMVQKMKEQGTIWIVVMKKEATTTSQVYSPRQDIGQAVPDQVNCSIKVT